MKPSDRLKRKVVSRLTGDVDVYYFDEVQIDGKVAKLTYGKRSILIQEEGSGYVLFLNNGGYDWIRYGKMGMPMYLNNTIEECKNIIKNDVMWEEVKWGKEDGTRR